MATSVCAVAETTSCQSNIDVNTSTLPACLPGVVKSFNKSKGYGFIRIHSQAEDVYFKTDDFTPRSKQRVLQVSAITGAAIACEPETFGKGRARARSVRLVVEGKQTDAGVTAVAESVKAAALEEPSLKVRPSLKKAPPTRPRGWGVQTSTKNAQVAELMAMGFTEAAAHDALVSGLDFNTVLDTLLSGGALPCLSERRSSGDSLPMNGSSSELDSLPATSAGSDDASDNISSCDSADKSPEANPSEPEVDSNSPGATETDCETLLGCDAVPPVVSEELDLPLNLSATLQSCADVLSEVPSVAEDESCLRATSAASDASATAGPPARQLARVLSSLPESANQFSVEPGTLIYVWADSATEHGWIYAERLDMGSSAGWLPTNSLKLLARTLQWRSVAKSSPSFSDLHLAAEQGDVILVDASSVEQAAEGGWAYVERLDGSKAGWFPTSSLCKISTKQQWLRVTNSQAAQHESQASVKEGDLLLVDLETRTKEGWAYAWAADRTHGDAVKHSGWVPVNCFEWPLE